MGPEGPLTWISGTTLEELSIVVKLTKWSYIFTCLSVYYRAWVCGLSVLSPPPPLYMSLLLGSATSWVLLPTMHCFDSLHNGPITALHWALVKTVVNTTIQLSLVGLIYCIILYYTLYWLGCHGSTTNPDSQLIFETHSSLSITPVLHLMTHFISLLKLEAIIFLTHCLISIKSVQNSWHWGPAMFAWCRAPSSD